MRYRDYKEFRENSIYHIFNRGNHKQAIFLDRQDYLVFLNRLGIILGCSVPKGTFGTERIRIKPLRKDSIYLLSYCLMPNHFHLQLYQNGKVGIDVLLLKLCTSYVKYFNKKYGKVGNLFQDTYKSKLIDSDTYCKYVSAYIHNNPSNPELYEYSSLKYYINQKDNSICNKSFLLGYFNNDTRAYLEFVRLMRKEHGSIGEKIIEGF